MSAPPITALMPVKECHPAFLDYAIRSMAAQDAPGWRLIVIAEPEEIAPLGDRLAGWLEDPRITLAANQGRKLSGAFNTGMRLAESEFVAILLGDDAWAPNAVSVLAAAIARHPSVDFFHSARVIVDASGREISSVMPSRESFELADFLDSSPVKHLLCWRRSLALAIGGMDETLNSVGPDDYDFPWTMAERGAVFRAIPECLYRYRDHREGFRLTTHLPLSTHAREIARIFRKHGATRRQALRKVLEARRSYLRQCLYATPFERRLRERLGLAPRAAYRESYD
jgi:glycosyltransferase involved in cell wall biosynthesis